MPFVAAILVAGLAASCADRARSNDNPPRILMPGVPRAGVLIEPAARHGGMVMTAGSNTVEIVIAPTGEVRIYSRDHDDNDLAPGATPGEVSMRPEGGAAVSSQLVPDRVSGGARAWLPAPVGGRTDYDVNLEIDGHRVHTGVAVAAGGTQPTLALQRAQGDEPVIPEATDVTIPEPGPPPSAVGGGPR